MAASEPSESAQLFRFSVFELDCRARELRRNGARIRLPEQPFQILRFLLERAGDVVTRDELRQRVWLSSVYVDFDHGLNNAIARLREALGDDAATPRFIETLPKLGYRFICPVEGMSAAPRSSESGPSALREAVSTEPIASTRDSLRWHRSRPALVAGVVTLGLGLLIGLWLARRPADEARTASPLRQRSIVVLPFANMDDPTDKEHFAESLSEEVLDKLVSIRALKVIGPTSSFGIKGQRGSPSVIAERLNVNYVLDGSVHRSGPRVHITAQLIDAHNERQLWSQAYERDFIDVFQVQDEIALAVAAALQVKLVPADELRFSNRGTHDAEAYRLYRIGITLLRGRGVDRDPARGAQMFEEALARDPQFAEAHAGLALYYFREAWVSLATEEESVRLGRAAMERAIALDPDSSEALLVKANFESWQSRFRGDFQAYTQAQKDYRRAIELDPSNSAIFFSFGRAILWDEPDLSLSLFERAIELDPLWDNALAFSAVMLSRRGLHDAARKRLHDLASQSLEPGGPSFNPHIGTLERQLGHLDEAERYLRTGGSPGELTERWSRYLSLGDRAAARKSLEEFHDGELAGALREAALFSMDARFDEAFASLERHRDAFPLSRILDLPTARFALITGHADRARALLEQRLPDLARGIEPVKTRNVIPALDLAVAYARTGDATAANQLLGRIAVFLDGPDEPRWPMFVYLRARTHALANEPELALQALERAYQDGFRLIWGLDLYPQPLLYIDSIDSDPAFTTLRADPRYRSWRERIKVDNARQLQNLRAHAAASPAA